MNFLYEFSLAYEPELNKQANLGPTVQQRSPTLMNFTTAEVEQPGASVYGVPAEGFAEGIYKPAVAFGGITNSGISESREKSAGAISLTVLRDFPIAAMFKNGTPPCSINLRIFVRYPFGDAYAQLCMYVGRVRSVEFNDLTATIQCQAITDVLQRPGLTQRFSRVCPYAWGDVETCGVDRNLWKWSGLTVEAISEDGLTITCALLAERAEGYYNAGLVEFGDNPTGVAQVPQERRMVVSHVGNTIVLTSAIAGLAVGSKFSIYKGCNRTLDACKSFNNAPNFGGFPYIPLKNIYMNGVK